MPDLRSHRAFGGGGAVSGAYYSEFDPFAAAWLRELIKAGHIPAGEVDERDMREVHPEDLRGFTQHHFFAGIGGWAYAARLTGWPDDRPLFTGSPPCQPFSTAGKQLGVKDDRHLAPHWLELVRAVRPPFVAGEQVAAAVNKDAWLDDLLDALEAEDYATGAIVLPASFVGAPHIRQRIFFVGRLGDGEYAGLEGLAGHGDYRNEPGRHDTQPGRPVAEAGAAGGVANSEGHGRHGQVRSDEREDLPKAVDGGGNGRMADSPSQRLNRGESSTGAAGRGGIENDGSVGGMADTDRGEREQQPDEQPARVQPEMYGEAEAGNGFGNYCPSLRERASQITPGWDSPDWLLCRDGKWRPVESRNEPMADGLPDRLGYSRIGGGYSLNPLIEKTENRVGRLRGYGNAIAPELAAQVLRELM